MSKEKALNLYAKIEPLIEFYQEYEELYDKYLKIITSINPKNILDFGCGNGRFLERLKELEIDAIGIDLSTNMVENALLKKVQVYKKDISELNNNRFELITATADVLNYFNKNELDNILHEIYLKLVPKGYLLADINTLYGFTHVAEGILVKERDEHFLTIEADFEEKKLSTKFTLFEKTNKYYEKEQAVIEQYFHSLDYFKKLNFLHLKQTVPVYMFDKNTPDKTLMILQKT
ncbi:MAG: class I SAM-dependent methyltransferase [Campylobacteraceae bacterium]|jgi:SAM-dependent methyltransferase|nr:class I SAM-dependent methyltransferase [Campylobacteraceae bacterium]